MRDPLAKACLLTQSSWNWAHFPKPSKIAKWSLSGTKITKLLIPEVLEPNCSPTHWENWAKL